MSKLVPIESASTLVPIDDDTSGTALVPIEESSMLIPVSESTIFGRAKEWIKEEAVGAYNAVKSDVTTAFYGKGTNDFSPTEIHDRIDYMLTKIASPIAYLYGGSKEFKKLNKELDEAAVDFKGGGNKIVPVLTETTKTLNEFAVAGGLLRTAGLIGNLPKGAGAISKAFETAKLFGTQDLLHQAIEGDLKEGGGGMEFIGNIALGMTFGLAGEGAKGIWSALNPSEQTAAYKLLGLKQGASLEEVSAAARKISVKYHPDKVNGGAEEFKKVIRARDAIRESLEKDTIYRGKAIVNKEAADTSTKMLNGEIENGLVKPPPTDPLIQSTIVQDESSAVGGGIVKAQTTNVPIQSGQVGLPNKDLSKVDLSAAPTGTAESLVAKLKAKQEDIIRRPIVQAAAEEGKLTSADIGLIRPYKGEPWADDLIKKFEIEQKTKQVYDEMSNETLETYAAYDVTGAKDALANRVAAVNAKLEAKSKLDKAKNTLHKAQQEMKVGDAQYAAIKKEITGKESSADMTMDEITRVQDAISKTDKAQNAIIDGRDIKAKDAGVEIISSDPDIATAQHKILKAKIANVNKTNKVVAKSVDKDGIGKHNYFDYYNATRNAIGIFEDNTGIPVSKLAHDINIKKDLAANSAEIDLAKMLSGVDVKKDLSLSETKDMTNNLKNIISNITKEENERISKYLFSEETRNEVMPLSDKESEIATRLEYALQGPIAKERMEEVLRYWLDYRKAPGDVGKFSKGQIANILTDGKAMKEAGRLKEYVSNLFDNGTRFGLRKFYYQSESEEAGAIEEYFKHATGGEMEASNASDATPPSLIGSESKIRKGDANIKPGSVFGNILKSYQRLKVRNALATDLPELCNRLNKVNLSARDEVYLKELYENVLMKGEMITPPFKALMKLSGTWWRSRLSLLNTQTALEMMMRNGLQTLTEAGQVVHVTNYLKNNAKVIKALVTKQGLESLDPAMAEDFKNNFTSTISQKKSIYEDAMFIELGNKVKSGSLTKKAVDLYTLLLDKTGTGFTGVDEISRFFSWTGSYMNTKNAADDYLAGKISMNKFSDLTMIDTMMTKSQTETALDFLSKKDSRGLANYMATVNTLDMQRGYKIQERAGIERTAEARTITGIYTYVKGRYDLYLKRGIVPLLEGIKDKDFGKAKRGAESVAKGIIGSWTADKLLALVGISSAYGLVNMTYNILAPAVGTVKDALTRVSLLSYKYGKDEISASDATKELVDILFDASLEFVPIPTKKWKKSLRSLGDKTNTKNSTRTRNKTNDSKRNR